MNSSLHNTFIVHTDIFYIYIPDLHHFWIKKEKKEKKKKKKKKKKERKKELTGKSKYVKSNRTYYMQWLG